MIYFVCNLIFFACWLFKIHGFNKAFSPERSRRVTTNGNGVKSIGILSCTTAFLQRTLSIRLGGLPSSNSPLSERINHLTCRLLQRSFLGREWDWKLSLVYKTFEEEM